jgi:hypothetical protein
LWRGLDDLALDAHRVEVRQALRKVNHPGAAVHYLLRRKSNGRSLGTVAVSDQIWLHKLSGRHHHHMGMDVDRPSTGATYRCTAGSRHCVSVPVPDLMHFPVLGPSPARIASANAACQRIRYSLLKEIVLTAASSLAINRLEWVDRKQPALALGSGSSASR